MEPKYVIGNVSSMKIVDKTTGEVIFEDNCTSVSIDNLCDDRHRKNLLERNVIIETDEDIGGLLKDNTK